MKFLKLMITIVNLTTTRVRCPSVRLVQEQVMESVELLEPMEERENKQLQQLQRDRLRQQLRSRQLQLIIQRITFPELIWVEAKVALSQKMKQIKLKIFQELDTFKEYLIYQQIIFFQASLETIAETKVILDLSKIKIIVRIRTIILK